MKNKGFTLIELLVVVAIIGILAAVGVVAYSGYTSSAKASSTKSNHSLASKYISSAVIGLTMLLEAVLGPIWAYFFINDIPSLNVFIGGSFILIGVILRLYFSIKKNKNESYT